MIRQLAQETVPNAAAIMHVYRGGDEDVQDDEFRREEVFEHRGQVRFPSSGAPLSADQYNRGSRPERRGRLRNHGRPPRERPPQLLRLLAVIPGRRARALRDLTPVTFAVTVA